jgi:predicted esterase
MIKPANDEGEGREMNTEDMDISYKNVRRAIDKEISLVDNNSRRVVLGGFSQGGAMSYYTFLKSDIKFGAVISMSGFIPPFDPKIISGDKYDVPFYQ